MNNKSCVLPENFISIYKIYGTLHDRLGYEFYLLALILSLTRSPEDKILIPAWPCNIVYISTRVTNIKPITAKNRPELNVISDV